MKDPERMHEHDPAKGAFAEAFQVDMGVLPYLGTPKGANLLNNFSIGVPWLSGITVVATRTDIPWDKFGSTVCDVGAGPGSVMLEVKQKYPKLNIICQELDHMIPLLQDVSLGVPGRNPGSFPVAFPLPSRRGIPIMILILILGVARRSRVTRPT